jgi:hypothetical protein
VTNPGSWDEVAAFVNAKGTTHSGFTGEGEGLAKINRLKLKISRMFKQKSKSSKLKTPLNIKND